MRGLTSIAPKVTSLLEELMGDPLLSATVTYKKHTGRSFNSELGYEVDTYSETEMTAIEIKQTIKSLGMSALSSEVEAGDLSYIFKGSDCPSGMSLKDLIVDGDGKTLTIKAIDPLVTFGKVVTVKE